MFDRHAGRRLPVVAILAFTLIAAGFSATSARAGNIIDDWNNVKVPPPPKLREVTVAPKTTALLVLDLVHGICSEKRRPRCIASLPVVEKLLHRARAHHLLVVYSTAGKFKPKDIWAQVKPIAGEPVVNSHADKFRHTALNKILRKHGIKTVVIVGTASHGAVLYTASAAAFYNYKVVVPVDGSSAENEYIEQYVAYNLVHAPTIAQNITLTTTDMLKF